MRKGIFGALAAGIAALVLAGGDLANAAATMTWDQASQSWVSYDIAAIRAGGGGRAYSTIPRETVDYTGPYGPNTIVVNTAERRLYLVLDGGKALKYGIGVGREGFTWAGQHRITRKAEWPGWTPPPQMIAREKAKGRILPAFMEGGPENPLGARAMYIGSTLYRIHGTSEPWTIGQAVSSGCIRLVNDDVIDLYNRVDVGTKVVVLN